MERVSVMVLPDIAVEIVSPSESASRLDQKVKIYLESGVAEVIVVYPEGQHLYIHTGAGVRRLRAEDTLTSEVLPGFYIRVGGVCAAVRSPYRPTASASKKTS